MKKGMSNTLIRGLREEVSRASNSIMGIHPCGRKLCGEAADRIEELEAAIAEHKELVTGTDVKPMGVDHCLWFVIETA